MSEMSEGYAVMVDGVPDIRTASGNENGARVNGLYVYFDHMARRMDTPEDVRRLWDRYTKNHSPALDIAPVKVVRTDKEGMN